MPRTATAFEQCLTGFRPAVRKRLRAIRSLIRRAAPQATECISYRMPTFKLDGPLIYFCAFKNHIGIYPMTGNARTVFARELAQFKGGKGTLQLPHDALIPSRLIQRIVRYRVRENAGRAANKKQRKVRATTEQSPPPCRWPVRSLLRRPPPGRRR